MNRIVLFNVTLTLLVLAQIACQSSNTVAPPTVASTPTASPTPVPMKYEDIVVGDGIRALWGGTATVKYVGKLADGTTFEEGKFDFKVGDRGIIKGFNFGVGGGTGIEAMKVGGKRKIQLPPELAYGADGDGKKVPPNATITFEIELLKVQGGMGF